MVVQVQGRGAHAPFGEGYPFCDPRWYQGGASPYYGASHVAFRAKVRAFVDEHVTPHCRDWDDAKRVPAAAFQACYAAGILPGVVGGTWPTEYAGPGPEGYDAFHELILIDELARCGSGGALWGLVEGLQIGLPPVLLFGSEALRRRVAADCLQGRKVISLCITETTAGSDVASLKCSAVLSGDGTHYVVNGEKKWITNGTYADFFTVAVRTGGPGKDGISMMLLERSMPGIETRQMNCQGVWASGTSFITFEDVRVPVGNVIGEVNQGFKYIMYNFNHERWGFVVQANRLARVCLEDAFKFALKRKTFGKRLVDHPVIRWKLAEMARQVEANHAALESLTYQMATFTKDEQNRLLGGECALLKLQATKVFEYCAREAAQILGGASYVRGGQGERVERLYREVRAYAIPGGSEEILGDLAARQAIRKVDAMAAKL